MLLVIEAKRQYTQHMADSILVLQARHTSPEKGLPISRMVHGRIGSGNETMHIGFCDNWVHT